MATHDSRTVVGELSRIAQVLEAKSGDQVAPAGPYEKSFVRYGVAQGTYYEEDGTGFIAVQGTMHTLDGSEDGTFDAVLKAWFQKPEQLFVYPPPPAPPFDRPGPVERIAKTSDTKGIWRFKDDSYLIGLGPAITYITLLKDGGVQFWLSATAFLTGGGGRFENAIGQETSLGAIWLPPPPPTAFKPGDVFPAKVTHSFRVVLGSDRGQPPQGGG